MKVKPGKKQRIKKKIPNVTKGEKFLLKFNCNTYSDTL